MYTSPLEGKNYVILLYAEGMNCLGGPAQSQPVAFSNTTSNTPLDRRRLESHAPSLGVVQKGPDPDRHRRRRGME